METSPACHDHGARYPLVRQQQRPIPGWVLVSDLSYVYSTLLAWKMSTVSFCCSDCSTPGATLRRNDTIPSLAIIFAACEGVE